MTICSMRSISSRKPASSPVAARGGTPSSFLSTRWSRTPRTAPCCAAREWHWTPVSGERWKSDSRISRRRSQNPGSSLRQRRPHRRCGRLSAKGRGAGAAALGECEGFGAFDERHNAPCLTARRGGKQLQGVAPADVARLGHPSDQGHAAPETLQVYSRARELLDETVPAKEQMAVLYGHWSVSVVRGEYRPGLAVARQSLALTAGKVDPEAIASRAG